MFNVWKMDLSLSSWIVHWVTFSAAALIIFLNKSNTQKKGRDTPPVLQGLVDDTLHVLGLGIDLLQEHLSLELGLRAVVDDGMVSGTDLLDSDAELFS